MVDARSYTSGSFVLELEGTSAGFLKSVDGGATYAEVIEEAAGVDAVPQKHIGAPQVEDFRLEIGVPVPKPLADWLSASWSGKYERKSGAVVSLDFNYQPVARREFENALLTEVGFPACDGSSKTAATMVLKLSPETARDAAASGNVAAGTSKTQKTWLPANFRLEIDGLECKRVSRIDPFTVKQQVAADAVGESREYVKQPGKLEFPNLKVTFSAADTHSWAAWFDDFVLKGRSGQENEKSGTITFLASDLTTTLFSVRLFNLGIFRLGLDQGRVRLRAGRAHDRRPLLRADGARDGRGLEPASRNGFSSRVGRRRGRASARARARSEARPPARS